MAEIKKQANEAAEKLLQSDKDQLYVTLGVRLKAIEKNPGMASSFHPEVEYDETQMGVLDDVREFGRKAFKRIEISAKKIVCGNEAADKEQRQQIVDAFGVSSTAVTSTMSTVFVSSLGLAPAIAAVIAALIVKVCFKSGYEAFCAGWNPEGTTTKAGKTKTTPKKKATK